MSVEAACVEPEPYSRAEAQLTDVERRPSRPGAFEPLGHGRGVRTRDRKVVERAPVAGEENTVAARESDAEMRRIGHLRVHGSDQLRPFGPCGLDRMHLAEPSVDRGVPPIFTERSWIDHWNVKRRPSTDDATADTEASSERRVGTEAVVTR